MRSRHVILCLMLLTLAVTVLAASAKLRATPKYDRIEIDTTHTWLELFVKLDGIPDNWFDSPTLAPSGDRVYSSECDEGRIDIVLRPTSDGTRLIVIDKRITPRGPLERLAWLVGWR